MPRALNDTIHTGCDASQIEAPVRTASTLELGPLEQRLKPFGSFMSRRPGQLVAMTPLRPLLGASTDRLLGEDVEDAGLHDGFDASGLHQLLEVSRVQGATSVLWTPGLDDDLTNGCLAHEPPIDVVVLIREADVLVVVQDGPDRNPAQAEAAVATLSCVDGVDLDAGHQVRPPDDEWAVHFSKSSWLRHHASRFLTFRVFGLGAISSLYSLMTALRSCLTKVSAMVLSIRSSVAIISRTFGLPVPDLGISSLSL